MKDVVELGGDEDVLIIEAPDNKLRFFRIVDFKNGKPLLKEL